ncbi:MAG: DUF2218 domain-containing protein [Leisingera sp.]
MTGELTSTACVSISPATRYLQQLAGHFAHKVEVEATKTEATVRLSYGYFVLRAEGEEVLVMQTFASTEEHRDRLQHVAASHLERFAFRNPPVITWSAED